MSSCPGSNRPSRGRKPPAVDTPDALPHGSPAHTRPVCLPMTDKELAATIDAAWEARDSITPQTEGPIRVAVEAALDGLDAGRLRVAEKFDGRWHVHQWLKKAVL